MSSNSGKTPVGTTKTGVEFKHNSNDAWYAVKLVFKNETLTLKYIDFKDSDMFDEHQKPENFKSLSEIDDFEKRFRPSSRQLQDSECWRVIEGMEVCASYAFGEDDLRFYDAVVEAVNFDIHSEEECTCTFVLFWEHGPNAGKKTSAAIENICLLQSGSGEIDPALTLFLKMCKEKLVVHLDNPTVSSESDNSVCEFTTTQERTMAFPWEKNKSSKRAKRSVNIIQTSKGKRVNHHGKVGEDEDLGGKSRLTKNQTETTNSYFLLIENLEKDLTSSVIVDFINKHVSVSSQAQVFPCLSSEPYTRGIIAVSGRGELQKLSDFLNDPAHIIVSSSGRPWVIPQEKFFNTVEGTFGSLMVQIEISSLDKTLEINDALELVHWGTEKFKKGKQLKELFMELTNHVSGLQERLELEGSKILQSSEL